MKTLKDKKGFTLIELLAVIVVLAIVTVLATRSVLPFLANAGRDAFAIEANEAMGGASDAMSLLTINAISSNYTIESTNTYCFTLADLKALGLWNKDDNSYAGTVTVTASGTAFSYAVEMYNDEYYVKTTSGQIDAEDDVKKVTDSIKSGIKISCKAGA